MGDGSLKVIGAIALGDQVMAADTDLTVAVDPNPMVEGDESVQTINTTWAHPFFDTTANAWVDAKDLKAGHRLAGRNGELITVSDVHNYVGKQWMNDLTVAEIHTYFIVVDGAPILVHNNGGTGFDACFLGDSPAAQAGKEVHNDPAITAAFDAIGYRRGPNAGADRPDFRSPNNNPVELKSGSPRGIREGTRQLGRYMRNEGASFGELWTYTQRPSGLLVLQRAATPRTIYPSGRIRWQSSRVWFVGRRRWSTWRSSR